MYKAIICDLDGTLLTSQHTVSTYTREIIKKLKKKGLKIFIATGRHHIDTLAFQKLLELNSFLITSNGAKIHNEKNEEIISHNIPEALAKEVINLSIDDEIIQNIYQNDYWYCNNLPKALRDFYKQSGFKYTIKQFDEVNDDVTKFFYICNTNADKLIDLEKQLITRFSGKLDITFSLPTCLEVINHGVSKGAAVKEVLKRENIDLKEAIAFGDGLNDYDMLKIVGKGLLMGNCNYRLREALPNLEIIDTNDNDGVARYLSEVFL